MMARKCVFDLFAWRISFGHKSSVQHYSPRFCRHTSRQSLPVLEMLQNILVLADFFANWRLLVRLFTRGAAAKHPLFGGETYKFLGSNAALWPEKSSLRNEINQPAIETPQPGSNFCRHNSPSATRSLLVAGRWLHCFQVAEACALWAYWSHANDFSWPLWGIWRRMWFEGWISLWVAPSNLHVVILCRKNYLAIRAIQIFMIALWWRILLANPWLQVLLICMAGR